MNELYFLSEFDKGTKFTENELNDILWSFEQVQELYGENLSWTRNVRTILQVGERYFALDWEQGLTECQENEFMYQPIEVYPKEETKVVIYKTYEPKKPKNELIITKDNSLVQEIQNKIVEFEKQVKIINEAEDNLKAEILKEMEERNIIKIENEDFLISYIAPSYRESFDSKAFKKYDEETYNKYVKLSSVKSSLKIKVK